LVCASATRLPKLIVTTVSTTATGATTSQSGLSAQLTRSSSASPAAFGPTDSIALTGIALAGATALAAGPERLWSPLAFQTQRGLQVEALAARPLLWARHFDAAGRWSTTLGQCRCWEMQGPGLDLALQIAFAGLLAGLAGLAFLHVRAFAAPAAARTAALAVRLTVLAVIVWIAGNKVFSPQYLVWLAAPLVLLGVLRGSELPRADAGLLLAACAATHFVFPVNYAPLTDTEASSAPVLIALTLRDVVLLALGVRLAAQIWRSTARA